MGEAYSFGDIVLDPVDRCLWCGQRRISLLPKDYAVLHHLVRHAGRLVTTDELLRAAWPDVTVGRAVVKVSMARLRRALGDSGERPRFIETRRGLGYRFLAPVAASSMPIVVGRSAELAALTTAATAARAGARRLVFVSGEPGIGKTTLLGVFTATLRTTAPEARVVWGHCIAEREPREAYGPILEALGRLCSGENGRQYAEVIARCAPAWASELPSGAGRRRLDRFARTGMLRQLVEALAAVASDALLVLCLEDLQWSDSSTLEALAVLGRRSEPARLLVLGTYRVPGPSALEETASDLLLRGTGVALPLAPLTPEAVGAYVARRFGVAVARSDLVQAMHARTAGNPLFLLHLLAALEREGSLVDDRGVWTVRAAPARIAEAMPPSLRDAIEERMRTLPPADRRLLEAASLLGDGFSAAAVAAAIDVPTEEADAHCALLARRARLLRATGEVEWPDRTVAGAYAFTHALYRDVVRAGLAPAQAVAFHARLGARLEAAWGERAREIALELARHAEGARQYAHAVHHLRTAAKTALDRQAYAEAARCLARAVMLRRRIAPRRDRTGTVLRLEVALASVLFVAEGSESDEVTAAFSRAFALWRRAPSSVVAFPTLWTLASYYVSCASHTEEAKAGRLRRALQAAARSGRPRDQRLAARYVLGVEMLVRGGFAAARRHFDAMIVLGRAELVPRLIARYGLDLVAVARAFASTTRELLGLGPNDREALGAARARRHPATLATALIGAATGAALHHDARALSEHSQEIIAICRRYDLTVWSAQAQAYQGWALALEGRLDEATHALRSGIDSLGMAIWKPYFLILLAETYLRAGHVAEAQAQIDAATRALRGRRAYFALAELWRCRAEVLLAADPTDVVARRTAARHLRRALRTAQRQRAVVLARRAADRLAAIGVSAPT